MKTSLKKIMEIIIYFFTPEDSTAPVNKPGISFSIKPGMVGLGSAKAVFWLINSMIFMYLISLL